MTDASLAHNIFALHALEQWGHVVPRGADLLTGGVPCYGVYPTRDGRWLAVGALEEKFWRALCAAIERPDLVAGQFALGDEGAARSRRAGAACSPAATLAEWTARFAAVDCCVTPIATLDEAMADPQFAAREMVVNANDGSREYAPPFKVSGHEFAVTRQAPAQGEHSAEILREAGYDASDDRRARRPRASSGFPDANAAPADDVEYQSACSGIANADGGRFTLSRAAPFIGGAIIRRGEQRGQLSLVHISGRCTWPIWRSWPT